MFNFLKKQETNSNSFFQSLIESLGDSVIIYDPNFRILLINSAAEKIFNIQKGEIINRTISPGDIKNQGLKAITQVLFPTLAPAINQISEGGWPEIVEITLDEPAIKLRTYLNRIMSQEGSVGGFIKICKDITREENLVESKREFLQTAAHQLQTPLTGINWAFESISAQLKDKPDIKLIADEGRGLAKRSLKIVSDLLTAARIEEGKFGYKFQEIDLLEILQEVASQVKIVVNETKITITLNLPPEPIKIKGDKERLEIALTNILDNAIKYNIENGNIDISLVKDDKESFVKIIIKDTGIGIPAEDVNKIFRKFYRGTNVVQVEPNGSGLGLYITRNIIKNHGGDLKIESIEGRGTIISITLPMGQSFVPKKETTYEVE